MSAPVPRPPSWQRPSQKRIPDGLPFVVRRSTGRVVALIGALYAAGWVLLTVQVSVGLLGGDSPDRTGGDAVAAVAIGACGLVVSGVLALITVRVMISGGPVLALDPAGLWIRNSRGAWGQAIWIPWASVERITRRRVVLVRMLAVTAGAVRYLAPLRLNNHTEAEILAAVGRFGGPSVLEP